MLFSTSSIWNEDEHVSHFNETTGSLCWLSRTRLAPAEQGSGKTVFKKVKPQKGGGMSSAVSQSRAWDLQDYFSDQVEMRGTYWRWVTRKKWQRHKDVASVGSEGGVSLGDKGLVIQMLPHQSERAQILRQIAAKRGQPPKVEPKTNTFLRQKLPCDRNSSNMYCSLHKGDMLHFTKL